MCCEFIVLTHWQGMDIPDIRYAVQFGAPDSLSVVTQRLGRAGRDGLFARAIILVQDAMFGALSAQFYLGIVQPTLIYQ